MILLFAFPTGKISLDNVFQERERLNHNIVGESIEVYHDPTKTDLKKVQWSKNKSIFDLHFLFFLRVWQ